MPSYTTMPAQQAVALISLLDLEARWENLPRSEVRVLADRYQLVEPIGQGGMGVVWRAWDPKLGRQVAIKEVLLPEGLTEDDAAELRLRTLREARTLIGGKDPGIDANEPALQARARKFLGELELTEDRFARLVLQYPDQPRLWIDHGRRLGELQRWDEAAQAFY